MVRT
ncbi:unnamed protein product, partial [Didymodactylos carnosus]|jgi:hypothetical protein